jgi:hypothetical protein
LAALNHRGKSRELNAAQAWEWADGVPCIMRAWKAFEKAIDDLIVVVAES